MAVVFQIGLAWFFLTYYFVYTQTRSYGHLFVSLGAGSILIAHLFVERPVLLQLLAFGGKLVFFVGLVIIGTFGRELERERFRRSSWAEIFLGRVPDHLRSWQPTNVTGATHGTVFSMFLALLFYVAEELQTTLVFALMALLFICYLFVTVGKSRRTD